VVRGRLVLLHDEHPRAHASDPELLVALDVRLLGIPAEHREERLHRVGRTLHMSLPARPHPAHDSQLAGPGLYGLGIHLLAGADPQGDALSR
jgi:hypothetical protein